MIRLIPIWLAFAASLNAQNLTCDCGKDLEFAYEKLQSAASYKHQMKGDDKSAFERQYTKLKSGTQAPIAVFRCYQYLQELLGFLNDYHLSIDGKVGKFGETELQDSAFVRRFRASETFRIFPQTQLDLDSLEMALRNEPWDSPLGIYHYRDLLRIAVFGSAEDGNLCGTVLNTQLPTWDRGQTILLLQRTNGNRYRAITANFYYKRLMSFPEMYAEGHFMRVGWTKDTTNTGNYASSPTDSVFALRRLSDEVQYLKLGSFNAVGQNLRDADAFQARINGQLTAPHLILDLRGNSGGGPRVSDQFFKLLKAYSQEKSLYVLVNFNTVSNAEQFTARLRHLPHTTLLGRHTNGTLSYGRNKPRTHDLPSGYFRIHLTDSKYPEYLAYEGQGIEPDVLLEWDRDWIEQVMSYIGSN